jgi:hypothetical protein
LLLQHYAHLLTSRKRSTIFDRFHLGELVYGPLLRGSSGLSASDVTTLNGLLQSLGVLTILCRPSWPICKANSSTRKEYIEDEEYRRIAWERWGEVTLPPQSIVYDYTTGPLDLRAYLPRS